MSFQFSFKKLLLVSALFLFSTVIYGCTPATSDSQIAALISGSSGSSTNGGDGTSDGPTNNPGNPGDGSDPVAPITPKTHNPEPNSIILLTSGLMGMAVYARKKQKKS